MRISQQQSNVINKSLAVEAQSINNSDDASRYVNKLHELGIEINTALME